MTKEEIRQLALDISDGKVFGSWMIPEEELDNALPIVFMPLAFSIGIMLEGVSVVYEYVEKGTSHKTHKGYPIFMSMKTLTKFELDQLIPLVEKAKLLKEEFLKGS